jgi:hypothetical protein
VLVILVGCWIWGERKENVNWEKEKNAKR